MERTLLTFVVQDSNKTPATVAELIDQCDQKEWIFPLLNMVRLLPRMRLQL